MSKIPFNSRDINYRSPPGAVPAGERVHFRVCVPRELECGECRLVVLDDRRDTVSDQGMFWCGMNGESHEWWECHFSADAGLFLYHFEIMTNRGKLFISKKESGIAEIGYKVNDYRLNVFNVPNNVPKWLEGGIIYQIFPDRFFNSGKKKKNVPEDRRLHARWDEDVNYLPDSDGKIRNKDYFGGDIAGITERLPYLKSLSVTAIYLNPIFEAHSNHRYDTADYMEIDPLLGTQTDFKTLCAEAKKLGISIILDGVFSHTGADSRYFNMQKRYDGDGAYQSCESPYCEWYKFERHPDKYATWWGFPTLPEVDETCPSYIDFICGDGGVLQKWLKAGARGFRLDVADELPDEFLDELAKAIKKYKKDGVIIGEVWEDASEKMSYGKRRRYFEGGQLDSVTNYPFCDAIFDFLGGKGSEILRETVNSVLEHYPKHVYNVLMNHIGTHDTIRAATRLAGAECGDFPRQWQAERRMSEIEKERAVRLMKCASLLQYFLPGVPSVYYGDEVFSEGYRDPFNRRTYPWGREDGELLEWYKKLGKIRSEQIMLTDADTEILESNEQVFLCERKGESKTILFGVNVGQNTESIKISKDFQLLTGRLDGQKMPPESGFAGIYRAK